ncbi:hypothetical protein D3C86_1845660 [compost metagenome]
MGVGNHRAGHRGILGFVLPIFLFDIVIDPVIKLVMLTTARPGHRCARDCTRGGTTDPST